MRHVEAVAPVVQRRRPAGEPVASALVPKVPNHERTLHALGALVGRTAARSRCSPKSSANSARGVEGPDDRGDGEGVDAAALFPEVPRLLGAGARCGRGTRASTRRDLNDQAAVQRLDELDIAEGLEVPAECPEHQRGLVLLDRQDLPGPRSSRGASSRRGCPAGVYLCRK